MIKVKSNFDNIDSLLNSFKKDKWKIRQARSLVSKLRKESESGAITEIVQSPYYQNIVNILGPYAIYYKVDQVLRLLKELETQQTSPEITKSPYYVGRV